MGLWIALPLIVASLADDDLEDLRPHPVLRRDHVTALKSRARVISADSARLAVNVWFRLPVVLALCVTEHEIAFERAADPQRNLGC